MPTVMHYCLPTGQFVRNFKQCQFRQFSLVVLYMSLIARYLQLIGSTRFTILSVFWNRAYNYVTKRNDSCTAYIVA